MPLTSSAAKLTRAVLSSSSLAVVIISIGGTTASAQITIQSTGTLSGTIQLPSINPNFNQSTTRVDTDSSGTYSRNLGSKNNPNYVPIYKSNYVQVRTGTDGSLRYFVDFKGIPIVSFNGALASPVLSGGELTPYKYQGRLAGTKFQGVVQDEFNLTRAYYTGTVTDPKTGNQYKGTFEVSGFGLRYSDRNGDRTPTVFNFKSDIPGKPTITSLEMTNASLVKLFIKVPATATPISTSGNTAPINTGGNTTPINTGGNTTPINTGGNTIPINTGGNTTPINTGGNTTPINTGGNTTPINTGGNTIPINTTSINTGSNTTPTNTGGDNSTASVNYLPTTPVNTVESNFSSPSVMPNIEFSSGNSFAANPAGLELSSASCSQKSVNCRTKLAKSRQAMGPRSRVLVR
jgi:hypothetical protein